MKRLIAVFSLLLVGVFISQLSPAEVPGRVVDDHEASTLVGGACTGMYARPCGGFLCDAGTCYCLMSSSIKRNPNGGMCGGGCSIWKYNPLCGGGSGP